MTVSVGRIRVCPVSDVRFMALVHITIRGAAGAAFLNPELKHQLGLISANSQRDRPAAHRRRSTRADSEASVL
jgi:hypothetical protein